MNNNQHPSQQHNFANPDKLRQQQQLSHLSSTAATATRTGRTTAAMAMHTPKRAGIPNGGFNGSVRKDSQDMLQMEYNSVKQENDKLKNIITKLKQEIDVYSRLLQRQAGVQRPPGAAPQPSSMPLIESILVSTYKRRKTATAVVSNNPFTTPEASARVLKDASKDVMLGTGSQPLSPSHKPASIPAVAFPPDDLAPEDLMLMNKLTDVLNRMD
ncbi:uncharacterized protein Ecym_6090 [Eremothecium cymbalariae DBVPG|uniref:Uncharacterized protein n=1 Tax=Eremothecium cymbalariae (strain CBS 270.75 / DBVPG 7215 / KCTC 17166 / NRRL Y-17582) TaxID=931890 RepID=G8JV07_ERECY|nr:hypothetical protein Ecym_6090 [Eremothecium cymbalariae DBVPG\